MTKAQYQLGGSLGTQQMQHEDTERNGVCINGDMLRFSPVILYPLFCIQPCKCAMSPGLFDYKSLAKRLCEGPKRIPDMA